MKYLDQSPFSVADYQLKTFFYLPQLKTFSATHHFRSKRALLIKHVILGVQERDVKIGNKVLQRREKLTTKPVTKPIKLSLTGKPNELGNSIIGNNTQEVNCDDPEKWFVKVFEIPDNKPVKYVLHTQAKEDKVQDVGTRLLNEINIEKEFKTCMLERMNDSLILKCVPKTKYCGKQTIILTKFLQITDREKSKDSIFKIFLEEK